MNQPTPQDLQAAMARRRELADQQRKQQSDQRPAYCREEE